MIISCHQPNLLPWNPFFEKVEKADIFILLENVQYTRHQFQNRFQFNGRWMTMPVQNGKLTDLILEKKYLDPHKSWKNIKLRVGEPYLEKLDGMINESLADTNISIIEKICEELKFDTQIIRDRKSAEEDRSRKLLNLCLEYGATEYLSGPSGRKYLDEKIFVENGIKVSYFEAKDSRSIIERMRA